MNMTVLHTPTKFEPYKPLYETKAVSDYEFLIGSTHNDDEHGMVYHTTRVTDENGLIVVHRRNINKSGR